MKGMNIPKYIHKLKTAKCPTYLIGQDTGLGLKEVYHPKFDRNPIIPKELQISEFYSTMKDDHVYYNDSYKHLILKLQENDNEYSKNKEVDKRISYAKDSIQLWKKFIEEENKNLPNDEYNIKEDTIYKLKEIWSRFKKRNKQTVTSEEVLPFHNEYTKHYKFDVPLHEKNMALMLHPNWGYFCKFVDKEFTFDEIINFYQIEFVSSYFRHSHRVI